MATTCSLCARTSPLARQTTSTGHCQQRQSLRLPTQRQQHLRVPPLRPLSIDWASEDTWFAVGAGILGIAVGIGAPAAYVLLQQSDEKKLEELRELNRQSYKETGQYMSEDEIAEFRKPRWTDRRQFEDDD